MMLPITAVPQEVWTSFLPPCLGFYKSEWTVSYGYGFGIALTALSIFLQNSSKSGAIAHPIISLHAAALVFYGSRLSLFLAIRSKLSQRMKEFNQRVEDRALSKGSRFRTRAPFVLSCGFLYYGLCAPLLFTTKLMAGGSPHGCLPAWATTFLLGLVALQWFGFGIAALADFTKTYVKQTEGNERFLVTSGIFSILRHPNYTGEVIGWTANALAGVVAATLLLKNQVFPLTRGITNLVLVVMGWIGIVFVLMGATGNLEARQQKDYADDPKYQTWTKSTWSGWLIPAKL